MFFITPWIYYVTPNPMRPTVCDTSREIVKNVLVSVKRQMVQHGGSVFNTAESSRTQNSALSVLSWRPSSRLFCKVSRIGNFRFPTGEGVKVCALVCFSGFTPVMCCFPLSPYRQQTNRIMGNSLICYGIHKF